MSIVQPSSTAGTEQVRCDVEVILTNKASGERLRLPLNPNSIKETGMTSTVTLSPITMGEVKYPRGEKCTTYAWDGTLPGASMQGASWVRDWREPSDIVKLLRQYKATGATLNLMVAGLPINDDVFIERFTPEYTGGNGNINYTIQLTRQRKITIGTFAPVSEPQPDETPTPQPTETIVYYKVKTTTKNAKGYARIYKSKSTNSKVLKKLKNGTEVIYVDGTSNKKWAKCTYGKTTGWMYKANITFSRKETVPAAKGVEP